jgi:hypothetical protein
MLAMPGVFDLGQRECIAALAQAERESAYTPDPLPEEVTDEEAYDDDDEESVIPAENIPVIPRKETSKTGIEERLNKLKTSSAFDYSDEPEKPIKPQEVQKTANFNLSEITPVLEVIFFGFLIVIGIWFIRKAIGLDWQTIFRANKKTPSAQFLDVAEPNDITRLDFEQEIKLAFQRNDFKALVRLHYLQLLYILNMNALIDWKLDKTDAQYQIEMAQHPNHRTFVQVSRTYSGFWFGGKPVSAQDWDDFNQMLSVFK